MLFCDKNKGKILGGNREKLENIWSTYIRAHVAKFYGRLWLIRSVWRASKLSVFKIDWNCRFVDLLHHPFWLQLVLALFGHYFSTFYATCLAKDHWRGFSTRNAHMVHIVNLFRLKWCIHLSRSLFLNK